MTAGPNASAEIDPGGARETRAAQVSAIRAALHRYDNSGLFAADLLDEIRAALSVSPESKEKKT